MTIVNDQAIDSFDRAYMACAESHVGGARDTSERCCIKAGISAAVPFVIAAQVDEAGEDHDRWESWWMGQAAIGWREAAKS